MTNIENLIKNLPYDLQFKIYKEYLEAELYYSLYVEALNSKESKDLDPKLIRPLLPFILSKKHVTKYFNNNDDSFKLSYNYHKINKKKIFKQLTNGESFLQSIVTYNYMIRYDLM